MQIRLASPATAPELVEELRTAAYVALDTEFHAERRYLPQLYLLQLHVPGGHAWIVDPLDQETLPAIALGLQSCTWLVHSGYQDIRLIQQAIGAVPASVLDTQVAAGLIGVVYPASYAHLTEMYLGKHLAKTETLSDWSRRPLSRDQLNYAADDVLFLPTLWETLLENARQLKRESAVLPACLEALEKTLLCPTHWRDVPGAQGLSPSQAAVLEQVFDWRETVARESDQPAKAVLPDPLLLEIAKRQPASINDLHADRRLPKNLARRWGEEILQRIHRGLSTEPDQQPRVLGRGTAESRQVAWLELFAEALGQTMGFAGRLVLPHRLAEQIVLYKPESRSDLRFALSPWRDDLIGDQLWAAVNGRINLSISDFDVRQQVSTPP